MRARHSHHYPQSRRASSSLLALPEGSLCTQNKSVKFAPAASSSSAGACSIRPPLATSSARPVARVGFLLLRRPTPPRVASSLVPRASQRACVPFGGSASGEAAQTSRLPRVRQAGPEVGTRAHARGWSRPIRPRLYELRPASRAHRQHVEARRIRAVQRSRLHLRCRAVQRSRSTPLMMRRRGKRGKHTSPRRPLSASKEEWDRWDAAAAKAWPWTFAAWARHVLNDAAAGAAADIHPARSTPARRISTRRARPRISARASAGRRHK